MTHSNSVLMQSWQRSSITLQQLRNLHWIPLWMVHDEWLMGTRDFDLVERVLTDIVHLWGLFCIFENSNKCFSFFGPRTSCYIYWVDNWNKMTLASQNFWKFCFSNLRVMLNSECGAVHACSVVSDLSNPMDCSPPGSSDHGILQERTLEWVAISSLGSPWAQNELKAIFSLTLIF